jgi:hypothetical protein
MPEILGHGRNGTIRCPHAHDRTLARAAAKRNTAQRSPRRRCREVPALRPASIRRGLISTVAGSTLGVVTWIAEFVFALLLPSLAVGALIVGVRVARWLAERRRVATVEPIDRLGANLRRLRAELEAMETRTGVPAKALRLRALRAAYLETLDSACRRLGVSPLEGAQRAQLAEIYRVESALRERGLDVRETAKR